MRGKEFGGHRYNTVIYDDFESMQGINTKTIKTALGDIKVVHNPYLDKGTVALMGTPEFKFTEGLVNHIQKESWNAEWQKKLSKHQDDMVDALLYGIEPDPVKPIKCESMGMSPGIFKANKEEEDEINNMFELEDRFNISNKYVTMNIDAFNYLKESNHLESISDNMYKVIVGGEFPRYDDSVKHLETGTLLKVLEKDEEDRIKLAIMGIAYQEGQKTPTPPQVNEVWKDNDNGLHVYANGDMYINGNAMCKDGNVYLKGDMHFKKGNPYLLDG